MRIILERMKQESRVEESDTLESLESLTDPEMAKFIREVATKLAKDLMKKIFKDHNKLEKLGSLGKADSSLANKMGAELGEYCMMETLTSMFAAYHSGWIVGCEDTKNELRKKKKKNKS